MNNIDNLHNSPSDIKDYLSTFQKIINLIIWPNVVIGGKQALRLHGLNMTTPPADLDLIIFTPTVKQMEALKILSIFDCVENRPKKSELDYPGNELHQKAMKFKKDGLFLDIIIAKHIPLPSGLLNYVFNGNSFPVNTIKNIIDAKRSYFFERQDEKDYILPAKYSRTKDMEDFIDLKNKNFNI